MKQIAVLLLLFLCCFSGGMYLARYHASALSPSSMRSFSAAPYPLLHRPIVLILIGKNNGAFVEKSLTSIFSQVYENYRVIYIDDASDDGSYELARDLIYNSGELLKVTLVRNEENLGVLPNLFRAVESCEPKEIVFILKDTEWLAHEWVFQKVNQYYADPDLWLAHGQACAYPSFAKKERPLQTCYASLLQQLPQNESLSDVESIAAQHWTHISEVLVVSASL